MNKALLSAVLILTAHFNFAQAIEIVTEQSDGSILIYAKNKSEYLHSVELNLELENMKSSEEMPRTLVVEGDDKVLITQLSPINTKKGYSYGTSVKFILGDVTAKHDDDHIYKLPYPVFETYNVDQGYFGNTTHHGKYALDFNMNTGDRISAIRDGVVFKVVDEHNRGCPNESCTEYNNYILIRHADGSIADYSHIKKNGAKVKEGGQIKAGDLVALSGATGWASGPHLHLEVHVMTWEGQKTVNAKYQLSASEVGIPLEGRSYTRPF